MLGWLTKLVAVLTLLGLLAFDGISVVRANVTAADHANTVASNAADVYQQTRDVQKAYSAAVHLAEADGETVDAKTFTVSQPNGHIKLTLHREAKTLWMYRIGALKKYLDIAAHGEGSPAS